MADPDLLESMKGVERTWSDARDAVVAEPKRWGACIYTAPGAPVTEHEGCTVVLFRLVKTAEEELRGAAAKLLDDGWKQGFGGVGKGIIKFEKGDQERWLALDKRRRA